MNKSKLNSNHSGESLTDKERRLLRQIINERQRVFDKFPLMFTVLGAFGLVATFYGFERLIDKVDVFANNPWILLGTGLAILIFTGNLYKKLQ